MDITEIRTICLSFKGVTEDIKWETHLCFNIGEKMFIITSPDEVPVSASFKVSDEMFDELSSAPGCKPAPYLARHKWIAVDDVSRFSKKKWEKLLKEAYTLVSAKLPAKIRKEIGI